ncbi:serine acetyltransferase [Mucilaginibacter hurinus]|uniref:Serine acetyltransferase n=2 Tax=Mucilaginibacter hurinus TaxID=2201324 RepID=A0A367GPP6_9SPHI|nr:serine acetyltransferase [Mucilaginibacter hurinus]RCH55055.1 serine acetyltransferase [Mucilaginibacter hurinus]
MSEDFYNELFNKQQNQEAIPSNDEIADWALAVIHLLYPERAGHIYHSVEELKNKFRLLQDKLCAIMRATKACRNCNMPQLAEKFFDGLPELYRVLNTDISAIFQGDPAAQSEFEVIRTYPGFYAIALYRVAHQLWLDEIPLLPRILTEYAHSKTGIDIHPAACIGEYFHIDHGTGIVIGESANIGRHVKLYQGVTLGALSVAKDMAGSKRHPTVEDHVVIYSGATILGGETVIGHHSIIGGNVWLTRTVAPHSKIYHRPDTPAVKTV